MSINAFVLGFLVVVWVIFSGYAAVAVFLSRPAGRFREHWFAYTIWYYGILVLCSAVIVGVILVFHVIGVLVASVFSL